MDKTARQHAIREIVAARPVASQEELRRRLARRGWAVTQSTLSRDLRELRLVRVPADGGGVRYAAAESVSTDDAARHLDALLPQLLVSVEGVQQLVVVRTVASGAQPVAAALDRAGWPDIAGTIAGDDTVLVVCRTVAGQRRVVRRIGENRRHG
jgi:transcriptional regulator of arginine metabolism